MKYPKHLIQLYCCFLISYLPLYLAAQCPPPTDSSNTFSCDAVAVRIQEQIPISGRGLLTSGWTQTNSEGGNSINDDWKAAFNGGTDSCGLPTHSNVPNIAPYVHRRLGIMDSIGNAFPTGNKENAQQDGWLLIPISFDCIDFRLGGADKGESSALFAGTGCDNMTLVGENNTFVTGLTNDFSYTLPKGLKIVSAPSCDYFLLRIRLYHNDPSFDESNSEVEWDIGKGFEIIPTGYLFPVSGHTRNDSIPSFVDEKDGAMLSGLFDENEQLWEVPSDCKKAATQKINIPYACYSVIETPNINCEPCAIELQEVGCICDDTSNTFSSQHPQSVTAYQQKLLVSSVIDESFTISNSSGLLTPPTLVENNNPDLSIYHYTVRPGMAYSFTITGNQSGVKVLHSGACAPADDCNCPPSQEVCGDGLDNDFDGKVDAADSDVIGDCSIDCPAIPLQIQGSKPQTDGKALLQIWSKVCGNFCCTGSANTQQSPVGIAPTMGGNATNGSRPINIPFTTTKGSGTAYTPSTLPQHKSGMAACVLQQPSLGLRERAIPDKMSRGRGDQLQMDAWLILPPGIECIDLRINHPNAHDGAALFLGPSIQDMDFIGAAWGLQGAYTYDTNVEGSSQQSSPNFSYDAKADGGSPIIADPDCPDCAFYAIRARWYAADVSAWMESLVQWNYGNGWENIPASYLQSVGSSAADADTDNNKPTQLSKLPAFCIYKDADGGLFDVQGKPYHLQKQYCEKITEIACFDCLPLTACETFCVEAFVDSKGALADTFPVCFLEVFQLTPKIIANTGTLLTQFWDGNEGLGFNRSMVNEGITAAFPLFTSERNCPNCLPQHPHTPTGLIQVPTLGINDSIFIDKDTDGDVYAPHISNLNGGENVQQDGWLLIPTNVSCIDFELGGDGKNDASRLYLGTHIDSMYLVGDQINPLGTTQNATFSYQVPANAPIIDADCANLLLPLRALRLRFYHHDNALRSNTIVKWNLGNGMVHIPATHLRNVENECSNTLPAAPTYTDGTPSKVVRDENGRFFIYEDFPDEQPTNGNYIIKSIEVDRFGTKDCYALERICGTAAEDIEDPKGVCSGCKEPYPSIADPCICLENGGAGIGQFAEEIQVTGPSGQKWYIQSVTGLSQAPNGVFPPEKGQLYPIIPFQTGPTGQLLTETKQANGISFYHLKGLHIADVGYSITLSEGITTVSIGNKCSECEVLQSLKNSAYHATCGRLFSDDGSLDGNYIDSIGQKTYTFCPDNPAKQSIRLQFTEFNLAAGDTFRVYTGNHVFSTNYVEVTGSSVGKMSFVDGVGRALPQGGAGWVSIASYRFLLLL